MSNQSAWAKIIRFRVCQAIGRSVLTFPVGMLLISGANELRGAGNWSIGGDAWASLPSVDAAGLVVFALIGVVLVSRRQLQH